MVIKQARMIRPTPAQRDATLHLARWHASDFEHAFFFNECHYRIQAGERLEVGHHKRLEAFGRGAHARSVIVHHIQVCAHVGRKVGFVNHEQITLGNTGAAFTGNFFTRSHVDHINRQV